MKQHNKVTRLSQRQAKTMVEADQDQTNWRRLDSLSEAELEAAIDHDEEGQLDWLHATTELPPSKQQLTVRFDIDVIAFFKAQGKGYQTRMNDVLKRYVAAQRR